MPRIVTGIIEFISTMTPYPFCPHCGSTNDPVYVEEELYKCLDCNQVNESIQFVPKTPVTKRSPVSGKLHTMIMPTSLEKIRKWIVSDAHLPLIGEYFPELNGEEREFLMTGILPGEIK